MSESKNDAAWGKLFVRHRIIENIDKYGFFKIRSSEINEFREARLMTKFDYRSQLPTIFAENKYSILPVSRGSYLISTFETFKDFENKEVEVVKIDFPAFVKSIDYNNITSESTALNCAYVSGILQDFTQEEELKPTVSGRMSSSSFNFRINAEKGPLRVEVENAQIEIDGGYEGVDSLNLVEAKNSISKDFLIRQVFYPQQLWSKKIAKKVRPLFLTYTNGIFHFREYAFEDPDHYNSISLLREKKYAIRGGAISRQRVQHLLHSVAIKPEPDIPFPQADSFERIINLCELLHENTLLSREEITHRYDFDVRQTNYYTDATRYLGLTDKTREGGQISYFLTEEGERLFSLSMMDRQLRFVELILAHSVFNKALKLYFETGNIPAKSRLAELMKESKLYKIDSESTFQRRSSTVGRWVRWVLQQIEE